MDNKVSQLLLWGSVFIWTISITSTSVAKELNPRSATWNPQSPIRNPQLIDLTLWTSVRLETRNSKLETRNSKLETRNSKLETRNSKLETRNLRLETRNSKLETGKRDRFLTASMLSLGAAGLLHLMADNSYQRYDEARDKATAEQERERTELLDNTRNVLIGIAGVCVAIFEYRSYTGAREKAPKMSLKPMIQVDERPSLGWHWTW